MKFGFFDSGLGGFLMMESCSSTYPQNEYVYVGDTAHLPYGPRDESEISAYMAPYLLWLLKEQKCDYVFIACNTASVKALPLFKKKFPAYSNKVIGIVEPTCDFLNKNIKKKDHLVVLATQGTVASGLYGFMSGVNQIPMPGLVELIEENRRQEALILVQDALSYYPDTTHLLLGCTHYAWLQEDLSMLYPDFKIISQDIILHEILEVLSKKIEYKKEYIPDSRYFVSSDPVTYSQKYNKEFQHLKFKNTK